MRRVLVGFLVVGLCGLVVGGPLAYAARRNVTVRNFRVVEEGVLYRSGQLTPDVLGQVIRENGIKTVVSLRTTRYTHIPPPDTWEIDFCAARGVKHVRIVPKVWGPDEKGEVPADQVVKAFLEVVADPANHPVLVHCFAGIHRTGTMCAVFRMERGWDADRAMAEMHLCGYDPKDMHEHVSNYLRGYRAKGR